MPLIEIGVPIEEIEARRARIEKTKRFEPVDRVAVSPGIAYRYLLPQIGVPFRAYYGDPELMLRSQIMAQKWLLEHIKTDQHSITGAWCGAWTDFQNAPESSALGCEVIFPENDIPWVKTGWLQTEAGLRTLEKIDVVHNGLHGQCIAYRQAMMAVAEKYPVRFQGGPVFYPGENPSFTNTSDGPFTVAADLMGHTEMFTAIGERPDFAYEVMRVVTDKIIQWLDFCWQEMRLLHRDFGFTDDMAAYLSPATYRKMVLPHDRRLRDHFSGRIGFHMCGQTTHLLRLFADELGIHDYAGFGYEVDLDRAAEVMGGRVVLIGNVNPMVILQGTPEDVKRETRRVLQKLAPYGGLIISDGANIAPGSPIENINAMYGAAAEYAQ